MKYKYFFLSLFILASCSQDEIAVDQSASQVKKEVEGIVMTGTDYLLNTLASRSGVIPGQTPEGNPTLKFIWKDGDQVGIFPIVAKDGSEVPNGGTQVTFPMKGGAGTGSANFDGGGWAMKSGYSYAAYYPLINQLLDVDKTKIPVSYANQVYKGVQTDKDGNPFVDFGNSDFMTAEVVTADHKGNITFKYRHVGAVIIMHCVASQAPGKITKFTITGTDPSTGTAVEFIQNGYVNLTQKHEVIDPDYNLKASAFVPGDQPGDKTQTLEIKFDENYKPEQNFDVYFTMAPNQELKDKTLMVEFEYTQADSEEIQKEKNKILVNNNIEAGKAYIWSANPVSSDKFNVEQAGTLADLVGSSYPETKLTVEGNINGDDLAFIQGLTNLESLNLNKSNIVEGGNAASKLNHISKGWFDALSKLTSLSLPESATSIDDDAFAGLTNAANCDLSVGEALARKIVVADDGSMSLAGTTFKSITLLDKDGKQQAFYTIDASSHTITTHLPGFITSSAVTEAMGTGQNLTLIVKGEINGRDFKSIREATGCLYNLEANKNGSKAPLTHLDLSGATIKGSADVYADGLGGTHTTEDNKLGNFVFMYSNLRSIKLPEGLTEIGKNALNSSRFMNSFNIPNTVEIINSGAFMDIEKVKSITMPNSVTTIGGSIFSECTELSSITLSENISEISSQMFYNCKALKNITIPASVKTIAREAFYYSGLTSLNVPATVESIGSGFINKVTSLRRLVFEGASTTLDKKAFNKYADSENCNLEIPLEWKDRVSESTEGKKMFENIAWKSIKIYKPDDDLGGMGFDDITDNDAF